MHSESIPPAQVLPVVAPDPQCAWCWPLLNPGRAYPNEWPGTICSAHADLMLAQHARLRIQRRTAAKEVRAS